MTRYWTVFGAAVVLLAAPVIAQRDEGATFFSLGSDRTYAPGEEPSIQMWAGGVDKLQFRVYRVSKPEDFLLNLSDFHRFDRSSGIRPRNLTLLERFHRWKGSLKSDLRNIIRAQYGPESRHRIRAALLPESKSTGAPKAKKAPSPAALADEFATVPVLNSQQLVSKWNQPVEKKQRWESTRIPMRLPGKGLYLVEATDGKLAAYTILSVTDIALVLKGAPGRILARAVDRKIGDGLRDIPVMVAIAGGKRQRFTSDADGFVHAEVNQKDIDEVMVLATRGEDCAAGTLYGWGLSMNEERQLTGYVYTDRPVYRPGNKVSYKGILRRQDVSGWAIPDLGRVEASVVDSDGEVSGRKNLSVSDFGTVNSEFEIPSSAALGYYNIELKSGDRTVNGGFFVEEYRKPEYEVRVNVDQQRVIQGTSLVATVNARYYYGEPVRQGRVEWAVYRSRYYPPWWSDEDPSFESDEDYGNYGGEQVLKQEGSLTGDGKATLRIPTPAQPNDYRYRIQARVTDASNREISGSSSAVATVGPFYLLVRPERYVAQPDTQAGIVVEGRDYDNRPVAGVRVRLEAQQWNWRSQSGPVVARASGSTNDRGQVTLQVPTGEGGSLRIRAFGRTPQGREVSGETYLWVSGGAGWDGAMPQQVQIIPDKSSYKPGDTARILIVTGTPNADIWVASEGRGIYESGVVRANGPTATMELKIKQEHTPNFFLTASFVHANQLFQGSRRIRVPATDRELTVKLDASKPRFQPGEQGEFQLEAKDSKAGRCPPSSVLVSWMRPSTPFATSLCRI